MRAPPKMKLGVEARIQIEILDFLENALPNGIHYHVPNGEHRSWGASTRLRLMGVLRGVPDIVCHPGQGITAYFEIKTEKGSLSPVQRRFGARAQQLGCRWATVRSVDEVRDRLTDWGVALT